MIDHYWKDHVRCSFRGVHSEPVKQPLKVSSQHRKPGFPHHDISAEIFFFQLICRYLLFKNASVPDETVMAAFTHFQPKTTRARSFRQDPSLSVSSLHQKVLKKGIPKVAHSILIQMVKVSSTQDLQPAVYIRM